MSLVARGRCSKSLEVYLVRAFVLAICCLLLSTPAAAAELVLAKVYSSDIDVGG